MLNSVFQEAKRIEWTFAILRWLYVPALLYISSFHNPASKNDVVIIAIGVGLANSVCCFINWKNESLIVQRILGFVMLSIDALAAWAVILLFVGDFYTAVYAIFSLIIIEAAIRFNLLGSLIMYAFFA